MLGYSLDPNTCFKNIHRLQPGHLMKVNKEGVKIEKFWSINDYLEGNNESNWKETFDASIRKHCISDVSIGSMLSGGLDSNLILESMQRQNLIDSNFKAYNAGSDKSRGRHTIIERNLATKSSKYFGVELVKNRF